MKRFIQACTYSLKPLIFFREKSNSERLRSILSIILFPVGVLRYIYIYIYLSIKQNQSEVNKVAVVLIAKNEGVYLNEYINFYLGLGCDLIIYDNDSTDNTKEIAYSFERVEYIYWPGKKRQNDAYNDAIRRFKHKYKYLMFFDADEFIYAKDILNGYSIYQILEKQFEADDKIACVGINWLIFGSSGLQSNQSNKIIDSFTHCASDDFEWNQLVKSIVRPDRIVGFVDPHLPLVPFTYKCVNTDGKTITLPRNILPNNKDIRLYHYFTKDKEHFINKVNKGMADRNAKRAFDEFYYYDKNDVYNDNLIVLRNYLMLENKDF